MKKTIQKKTQNCFFILCLLAIIILSPALASANIKAAAPDRSNHLLLRNDTIVIKKSLDNKNFKFYSPSGKQTLFFSTKLKQKKVYRFYMFDVEGNLVAENNIVNRQGIQFTNMQKGNYYFEILCDDEKIENGSMIIK